MSSNTSRQFYKEFLKCWKEMPKQRLRRNRLDVVVRNRIEAEFRNPSSKIENANNELYALKSIVQGSIEKQYPLSENSIMKAYLASPNTFKLLDSEGQDALDQKRSPFSVIYAYLTGKEKMRNV